MRDKAQSLAGGPTDIRPPDTRSSDAASSGEHLKHKATRGVALLSLQSVASRVVLLATNWILGALLTQEDFGVNGMVTVVSAFAWTFVGFGMDEVLVQRAKAARYWEATVFRYGLAIALATSALVAGLAPAVAWAFHEPRVIGPILVLATAFPLAALSTVQMAKVSMRMDFTYMAQWSTVELVVGQGLMILFGWMGAGIYTFALPVPIVFALRAVAFWAKAPPGRSRLQKGARRNLMLRKGALVAGSKIVNTIVGQGDYVVLGLMAATSAVGYYFFAFRLAAVPARTIANSLSYVLLPAMTTLKGDRVRQSASAVKSAVFLSWVVVPFCYYQSAIAKPVLTLMFGHKWDLSILIIQILGVGLSIEGVMAVTRAYLGASGQYRTVFAYAIGNCIGFIGACVIGVMLGSTVGLSMAVSIYYAVSQPALFAWLVDRTGRRWVNFYRIFLAPALASSAAFGAGWIASLQPFAPQGSVGAFLTITVVGWPLCLLGFWLLARDTLMQLGDLAMGFLRRKRGAAVAGAGE